METQHNLSFYFLQADLPSLKGPEYERRTLPKPWNAWTSASRSTFHHHFIDTTAPNAGLEVAGAGPLRLPLTTLDADALLSLAVSPSDVAWCGELDATLVSFRNPRWATYIAQSLLLTISHAFKLPTYATDRARCRLDRLIVFVADTRGPAAPYSLKTPRSSTTLAHILITLPSEFQGGRTRILDVGEKDHVIDDSRGAEFNTSAIAWYTDTTCAMDPLTSGCRLCLEYALEIDNLPSILPRLPSPARIIQLQNEVHRTLSGWKNGFYQTPFPPIMVYPYEDVGSGISTVVAPVARNLGFLYQYDERRRRDGYDYDDYEYQTKGFVPLMGEVYKKSLDIQMKDCYTDKNNSSGLLKLQLDVGKGCLTYAFFDEEEDEPDDAEYDGFGDRDVRTGLFEPTFPTAPFPLTNDFHCPGFYRNAILLVEQKNELQLMVLAKGASWAITQLQTSPTKPANEKQTSLLQAVVRYLTSNDKTQQPEDDEEEGGPYREPVDVTKDAKSLLLLALKWKDIELWQSLVPLCGFSVGEVPKVCSDALNSFGVAFTSIATGIEDVLDRTSSSVQGLMMLNALHDVVRSIPRDWYLDQVAEQLSDYGSSSKADIPIIIETAKRCGLDCLVDSLLPHLPNGDGAYDFLLALLKAVREITGSTQQQSHAQHGDIVRACFLAAAAQWKRVPKTAPKQSHAPSYSYHYSYPNSNNYRPTPKPDLYRPSDVQLNRIRSLIKLALSDKVLAKSLPALFEILLPSADEDLAELEKTFQGVYVPLVPRLKGLLADATPNVAVQLKDFLHDLIRVYLDRYLGTEASIPPLNVPSIACSGRYQCYCKRLDKFLNDASAPKISFTMVLNDRAHLEQQIAANRIVSGMVETETLKRRLPHTLVVTKKKEVLERYTWEGRKAAARAFLESIGDKDVLVGIMGEDMFTVASQVLWPSEG
ncbi:hypothetical protein NMY22_g7899 [Coprinellus aureogranulatus]|nr:hypothetical protein NMY22_g7899 [Coprinellus aureogranulatus]